MLKTHTLTKENNFIPLSELNLKKRAAADEEKLSSNRYQTDRYEVRKPNFSLNKSTLRIFYRINPCFLSEIHRDQIANHFLLSNDQMQDQKHFKALGRKI